MTESITTPTALVQTTNGKRFYVNSGIVSVADTETAVIDIANIGERDIKFSINPISADRTGDHMTMKVKNNGLTIFQELFSQESTHPQPYVIHFIITANTSLSITFENIDSTAHNVGASCYGRYLSM